MLLGRRLALARMFCRSSFTHYRPPRDTINQAFFALDRPIFFIFSAALPTGCLGVELWLHLSLQPPADRTCVLHSDPRRFLVRVEIAGLHLDTVVGHAPDLGNLDQQVVWWEETIAFFGPACLHASSVY